MAKFKSEYKRFTIIFDPETNESRAYSALLNGEEIAHAKTHKEVMFAVDRYEKAMRKFKPIQAFRLRGNLTAPKSVSITSINPNTKKIHYSEGDGLTGRGYDNFNYHSLYEKTEKNMALVEQINSILSQTKALLMDVEAAICKMDKFDAAKFMNELAGKKTMS
jgi:hypothetical protein